MFEVLQFLWKVQKLIFYQAFSKSFQKKLFVSFQQKLQLHNEQKLFVSFQQKLQLYNE